MPYDNFSIVYMGTPRFAVPPLHALVSAGFNVKAVVTIPDKPSGRGRKINPSEVKHAAISLEIPVLQPNNLKDEGFLKELDAFKADLFVVVAFRMLPKKVWEKPRLGTFNLHGSLLPRLRGAAPIHWAVINGHKETGLTTFLIDEQIDTGKILLQEKLTIQPQWTTGELHDALLPMGAQLVLDTAKGLADGSLSSRKQNNEDATHAPKLTKENTRLDFRLSPAALVQLIKGLNPSPAAYYGKIKFLEASLCDEQNPSVDPMLRVKNRRLFLDYVLGSIEIKRIKPAGKRSMSSTDYINGLNSSEILLK
ncbi:MAG TPA: methionyl-tRNA formyltransferase [Cryomorphaceae bacterium]|nr:methionyl-tRNA formyltransferase [Cryomorphaceae bacterium]|tara:strand:- start:1796 stop:2719 length:924 start_codon:yes stop_codon:yes gene_type:complete